MGAVENERNTRKGALPTLRFDQSEIVGSTAAVNALPGSCPPLVFACKLENAGSHGGASIRDTAVLRYDNIAQPYRAMIEARTSPERAEGAEQRSRSAIPGRVGEYRGRDTRTRNA